MRILYVIDRFATLGGAEGSTAQIMLGMVRRGHEVSVLVLEEPNYGDRDLLASISIPIRVAPKGSFRAARALRNEIQQGRPDVVHSVLPRSDLVVGLAALRSRFVAVTSLVNTWMDPGARKRSAHPFRLRGRIVLMRLIYRRCFVGYHAISQTVAEVAVREFGIEARRVRVVYRSRLIPDDPSVRSATRQRVRQELGITNDRFVILNVGRQDTQKGQRYLLQAVSEIRSPQATVLIAGRVGSASDDLKMLVSDLDDRHEVRLLGMRADVLDLMAAADLFVFPSLWEGLGGSLLEAMGMRLPVVGFDLPIVREATGGHARLVAVLDSAALAEAIREVMNEERPVAPMVDAARRFFDEMYSPSQEHEGIERLYGELASSSL